MKLKRLLRTLSLGKKIDSVNLAVLRTIKFCHYIINFYCFVISYYLSHFLRSQDKSWIVTLSSLWMGHTMYFSLGNSNSLASVDISAGYVGLEDFVPSIMVPLTYVATYCGPCLWLMAGILSVIRNTRDAVRWVQVYLHLIFMIYFISNITQDGTITFTISKRNFCTFQLCLLLILLVYCHFPVFFSKDSNLKMICDYCICFSLALRQIFGR